MERGEFCAESGHHGVQFYSDDGVLSRGVAEFLAEGLKDFRPAIVIATPEHRHGITDELVALGVDVDAAVRKGALRLLDAEETLAHFTLNGIIDPGRFKKTMGAVLAELSGTPRPRMIRAYGEMVDVLWRAGHRDGAILLEVLWNELAMTHSFALLCGYSRAHMRAVNGLRTVCNQHTHVLHL